MKLEHRYKVYDVFNKLPVSRFPSHRRKVPLPFFFKKLLPDTGDKPLSTHAFPVLRQWQQLQYCAHRRSRKKPPTRGKLAPAWKDFSTFSPLFRREHHQLIACFGGLVQVFFFFASFFVATGLAHELQCKLIQHASGNQLPKKEPLFRR